MGRVAMKKEVAKTGRATRRACNQVAKRVPAKANEMTVNLGGKVEAIKKIGRMIGGRNAIPMLEDKATVTTAGLVKSATPAKVAMLSIAYLQMIAE